MRKRTELTACCRRPFTLQKHRHFGATPLKAASRTLRPSRLATRCRATVKDNLNGANNQGARTSSLIFPPSRFHLNGSRPRLVVVRAAKLEQGHSLLTIDPFGMVAAFRCGIGQLRCGPPGGIEGVSHSFRGPSKLSPVVWECRSWVRN